MADADGPVDVLIAGGGPAGAAAALTLARAGRQVLLVERRAAFGDKAGEGLPPAARRLLTALGVWDAFRADGHLPAWGQQSLWGSPDLAYLDFLRDPDGHGWHLDRPRFDARLRAEAAGAGAEIRTGVRIEALRPLAAGGTEAVLSDGTILHARWLVDATGRAARFARRLGPPPETLDHLVAFGLFVLPGPGCSDEDGSTLVEAAEEGWWYTARLPDGRRALAFFTDHDLLAARQARTAAGFAALLAGTAEMCRRLEPYVLDSAEEPAAWAAATQRLAVPAGPGWIAVGDAAFACDPLASQGILTALYTGLLAGQAVAAALDGETRALAAYPAAVDSVFQAYRRHRGLYYGQERRFAGAFWRRRRTAEPQQSATRSSSTGAA